MSAKSEPIHRGTLVCVVLKAKNLPNKKSIGKQDPYCTLQLGTDSQKTKPDKRGGQHPTWDEQLHFEIYDDMEDQLRSAADATGSIGTSSPKKNRSKISKTMRVACYADDTKEPEFIGDGVVDLTDTLNSGEFDEWVTIKAKDRYAGEVYLELTFYSAAAPPKRKKPSQPIVPNGTTYGGAGTFSEDVNDYDFAPRPSSRDPGRASIPSYMRPETQQSLHGYGHHASNSSTLNSSNSHAHLGAMQTAEEIPQSLRPSASLAQLDTYTPPYAPPQIQREKSPAPTSYLDHRRGSLPPGSQHYGTTSQAQHYQEGARYGQPLPPSLSQQQPLQQSISTLRPIYDGNADDLTRPLSSMSVNARPESVTPQDAFPSQHYTHASPYSTVQGAFAPGLSSSIHPSSSIDAFGRPAPPHHSYSAAALPITGHGIHSQFPAHTPPPPPNSAPPPISSTYQLQGGQPQQSQWVGMPQQQSSLPPAPFMPPGRPLSAADMASPIRPLSSSGYHALPFPPAPQQPQQQQQQQQHDHTHYQQTMASPAEYAYPSPNTQVRPLPPTAMVPSPSPSFANAVPASNYYPPPAQTPSHYVAPQPLPQMMPWNNQQNADSHNTAYSSYPPPPPGPINGDYVHTGLLQASPSTHPGQYPPPPPMHHVEYAHQQPYYSQSPAIQESPVTPLQQQPPPTQTYYRPQAQHPF